MLGNAIPNIESRIHYVVAVVIVISLLPPGIALLKATAREESGRRKLKGDPDPAGDAIVPFPPEAKVPHHIHAVGDVDACACPAPRTCLRLNGISRCRRDRYA